MRKITPVLALNLPTDLAENFNVQIDPERVPVVPVDDDYVTINGALYRVWDSRATPAGIYLSLAREHAGIKFSIPVTVDYFDPSVLDGLAD
jgi:hypothetical protein